MAAFYIHNMRRTFIIIAIVIVLAGAGVVV